MSMFLTNNVIQLEAEFVGRRLGFTGVVRAASSYAPMSDIILFQIIADERYYSCQIQDGDLNKCLDDFSKKYIQKGMREIAAAEIQYDDAGQVI